MLKTKNSFVSFLVIITIVLSLTIITKTVLAQWTPPPSHPGEGQPGNILFNPLLEDINANGKSINNLYSLSIGNDASIGLYSQGRIGVKGEGQHGVLGIGTGPSSIGEPSYGIFGKILEGGTHAGYFEGKVNIETISSASPNLILNSGSADDNPELRFKNDNSMDYTAIYYDNTTEQLRIWNDENLANFDNDGNIFVNRLAISTTTSNNWDNVFDHADVKLQVDGQTRIDLGDYSEYKGRDALIFNLAEDSGGIDENQYPEQQKHIVLLCDKEDPSSNNDDSCDYFQFYSIDRPKFGEEYGGDIGRTAGIIASELLSHNKWADAYYLDSAVTGIGCTEDIYNPYNGGSCTSTTSLKVKGFIKSDIYGGGGDQNVCVNDDGKFFVGNGCGDVGGQSSLWTLDDNGIYYNDNVGIGGSSHESFELYIHGDTKITGETKIYGNIKFFGDIKPGDAICDVDQILKKTDNNTWRCADDNSGSGSSVWNTSGNNIYYNDGNVGIGIVDPTYKLHINVDSGEAKLALSSGDRRLAISQGSSGTNAIYDTNNQHEFKTDGAIRAFFGNTVSYFTGNVGIGRDNPSYKLDVEGDVFTNTHLLSDAWYGTTGDGGAPQNLWIGDSDDDIKIQGDLEFGNTENDGDPKLYKDGNSLVIDIGS